MNNTKIRQETIDDYLEVYQIVKEAFLEAEHTDGKEQDLVVSLRKGESFIPALSLVAEREGEIVGYILFTKAKLGEKEVLVLAPLAVRPKFQKRGIGSKLVTKGHQIAKDLGYEMIFVLGSEKYYPKFCYRPTEEYGMRAPKGIPSINFMLCPLSREIKSVDGELVYAKEFYD